MNELNEKKFKSMLILKMVVKIIILCIGILLIYKFYSIYKNYYDNKNTIRIKIQENMQNDSEQAIGITDNGEKIILDNKAKIYHDGQVLYLHKSKENKDGRIGLIIDKQLQDIFFVVMFSTSGLLSLISLFLIIANIIELKQYKETKSEIEKQRGI